MIKTASALALMLGLAASGAVAQPATPAPLVRTVVDRADITAGEAIQGKTEVPAGATSGRHIHHGVELVYVIEGTMEMAVDGQPTRIMHAGDTILVRRDVPHEAKGVGPGSVKLSTIWVVDKDRPLAEPVK